MRPLSIQLPTQAEFKIVILRAGPEGSPTTPDWEPLAHNRRLDVPLLEAPSGARVEGAMAWADPIMSLQWRRGRDAPAANPTPQSIPVQAVPTTQEVMSAGPSPEPAVAIEQLVANMQPRVAPPRNSLHYQPPPNLSFSLPTTSPKPETPGVTSLKVRLSSLRAATRHVRPVRSLPFRFCRFDSAVGKGEAG